MREGQPGGGELRRVRRVEGRAEEEVHVRRIEVVYEAGAGHLAAAHGAAHLRGGLHDRDVQARLG